MTALVMMAILLAGVLGYRGLPVSDLPTIDLIKRQLSNYGKFIRRIVGKT